METAEAAKGGIVNIDVTRTIDVTDGMPWSGWPVQRSFKVNLNSLRAVAADGRLDLHDRFTDIGTPSNSCLHELSTRAGFPTDFLRKLTLPTQATVITERLREVDKPFTFTGEQRMVLAAEGMVPDTGSGSSLTLTNACPGWRGVVASTDVCETVYRLIRDVYGDSVSVRHAVRGDGEVKLRVMTGFAGEVKARSSRVGDVMDLGIDMHYRPGFRLAVMLFTEVLRCENGMRSAEECFSWKSQDVGRPEDQLAWLTVGVANAIGSFDRVLERSNEMASTELEGDVHEGLLERMRAMAIPARFYERLKTSFDTYPGRTEWHMLQAMTHLATHGGLPQTVAEQVQDAAGAWTEGFDMVNARLPRAIAARAGATILEATD